MKTSKITLFFGTLFLNFVTFAQQTHTYNFTSISVHLSHTANVSNSDFIQIINQGIPAEHDIRFGLDTYFLEEDILSTHNTIEFLDTGQGITKAMSEIASSLFYIRVSDPLGIIRLTLTVNRGFAGTNELETKVLTLYPNPCIDEVFISGFVGKLVILDSKGNVIFEDAPQSANVQIQVSEYAHGIYFVVIDDRNWFKLVKN